MVAAALRCLLETGERVGAKGTTSVFGGSERYDSEAEKAVCHLRPPSDSADYSWPDFGTFWPQLACPDPNPSLCRRLREKALLVSLFRLGGGSDSELQSLKDCCWE